MYFMLPSNQVNLKKTTAAVVREQPVINAQYAI